MRAPSVANVPWEGTSHVAITALARVISSSGRWLLPWLSVLLLSASLALAITTTESGSRATHDGQPPEIALTPLVASLPPIDAVAQDSDGRVLGRSCASLFGSSNGWLFSSDRQGPCRLGPDATTPVPDHLSPATAAPADGDAMRARFGASLPAQ